MPEIPLEVVDAAAEAHRKRCEQLHAPSHNESATLILRTALPFIEQAIRNEERVKVREALLGDEAIDAGASAESEWLNPLLRGDAAEEERQNGCEPFKTGVEAALATLDQEGCQDVKSSVGGRDQAGACTPQPVDATSGVASAIDCLDKEEEAPVGDDR